MLSFWWGKPGFKELRDARQGIPPISAPNRLLSIESLDHIRRTKRPSAMCWYNVERGLEARQTEFLDRLQSESVDVHRLYVPIPSWPPCILPTFSPINSSSGTCIQLERTEQNSSIRARG
jgi:hypothetical protein